MRGAIRSVERLVQLFKLCSNVCKPAERCISFAKHEQTNNEWLHEVGHHSGVAIKNHIAISGCLQYD